jgi:hypothetical protein
MRYIKTYEKSPDYWTQIDENATDCGYYIESQLPTENLIEWYYDISDKDIREWNKFIEYTFCYTIDIEEDDIIRIYDFLEKNRITEIENKIFGDKNKESRFKFTINLDEVSEFAELHKTLNKYNL